MPRGMSPGHAVTRFCGYLTEDSAEETGKRIAAASAAVAALTWHVIQPCKICRRRPVVGVGRPLQYDIRDLALAALHLGEELGIEAIDVIAELQHARVIHEGSLVGDVDRNLRREINCNFTVAVHLANAV